jgi:hypothetical protein
MFDCWFDTGGIRDGRLTVGLSRHRLKRRWPAKSLHQLLRASEKRRGIEFRSFIQVADGHVDGAILVARCGHQVFEKGDDELSIGSRRFLA